MRLKSGFPSFHKTKLRKLHNFIAIIEFCESECGIKNNLKASVYPRREQCSQIAGLDEISSSDPTRRSRLDRPDEGNLITSSSDLSSPTNAFVELD